MGVPSKVVSNACLLCWRCLLWGYNDAYLLSKQALLTVIEGISKTVKYGGGKTTRGDFVISEIAKWVVLKELLARRREKDDNYDK